MKTMVGEMQTKENTGESEDSELAIDKKSVADDWFDNLDNGATEHESDIKYHTKAEKEAIELVRYFKNYVDDDTFAAKIFNKDVSTDENIKLAIYCCNHNIKTLEDIHKMINVEHLLVYQKEILNALNSMIC